MDRYSLERWVNRRAAVPSFEGGGIASVTRAWFNRNRDAMGRQLPS